jgi:tetratricopeptide (TPR) repeat protein
MRHRLEKYPNDFSAHLNLGALLLSRLDAQGAVSMLEAAIRIDPARPEAHDMLGSAFRVLGRSSDALNEFRLALRVEPDYIDARYNLALALAKSGKFNEAVANFRVVLAAFPGNARLESQFNDLLARQQAAGR